MRGRTPHSRRFPPIDIVDVFRKPDDTPQVADEAVHAKAKALWCRPGSAAKGGDSCEGWRADRGDGPCRIAATVTRLGITKHPR